MLDVYAAREDPEPGVTGRLVAAAVPGGRAQFIPDARAVPGTVASSPSPVTSCSPWVPETSPRSGRSSSGHCVIAKARARDTDRPRPPGAAHPAGRRGERRARRRPRPRARHVAEQRRPGSRIRGRPPSSCSPSSESSQARRGRCSAPASSWSARSRSAACTGSRAQVLAAAGIPIGPPLVRVDTAAVSRRVDAITQVQSAHVTRSWPDGLVINVTERTPALAVADGSGYDLVDRFGVVVVSAAPRRPPRMPLFRPSGPLRGNPAVAAAVAVLHELPASLSGGCLVVTRAAAETSHCTSPGG